MGDQQNAAQLAASQRCAHTVWHSKPWTSAPSIYAQHAPPSQEGQPALAANCAHQEGNQNSNQLQAEPLFWPQLSAPRRKASLSWYLRSCTG